MALDDFGTQTIRKRFDRDARVFDTLYDDENSTIGCYLNRLLRKGVYDRFAITFAVSGRVAGRSVLDIGCGAGPYVVRYAQRGARRVLGIDLSEEMLERARLRAKNAGMEAICDFRKQDFASDPVGERFDISIAMGVFDYLEAPAPFLRKMVSCTNDLIVASFPGRSLVRQRLRQMRYMMSNRGGVRFYSAGEVRRLADGAGLEDYSLVPMRASGGGWVLAGFVVPPGEVVG